MEPAQLILLIPLIIFPITLIILYQSYRTNRQVTNQMQTRLSRTQDDSYESMWIRMAEEQSARYRPSRRPNLYRSGLTAGRAGHNVMEQHYQAERTRIHKEAEEEAKKQNQKENLKHQKELEEQRIKKEKLAYKKPGRSSRVEKAARILDELENSKKRKVN